jgi:hypothetical protein
VLDNTFNLNISPTRNPGSTNIIANGPNGIGGYAKKYMFSIENLAWRTSTKQGYTYDDLPVCEKGPNGGRVMWFPPYDLKFNDTSTANWSETSFLGRPEPIYTYKDTKRTGSLSWKIIVDHPSVINTIVDKQLKGVNKDRMNSILDSFFAGCVKYDIYELAKKFNTVPTRDLYTYQEILTNPKVSTEDIKIVSQNLPKENAIVNAGPDSSVPQTNNDNNCDLDSKYNNFGFYFDNDIPGPSNRTNPIPNSTYKADYDNYTDSMNQDQYVAISNSTFSPPSTNLNVKEFFENIVIDNFNYINNSFIEDAFKILSEETGIIKISLKAAASAPANETYNKKLSERRANSVIDYFKTTKLAKFINETQTLTFSKPDAVGEDDTAIPKSSKGSFGAPVTCTQDIKDKNNKTTKDSQKYSVAAMACRRVVMTDITVTPVTKPVVPIEKPEVIVEAPAEKKPEPKKPEPIVTIEKKLKDGISKQVLRNLFSECDYFDVIKENAPMLYDSIQEKLKYFNPAFHSMTPEGLNSRLTFLNQCVRPGETIPVIGSDGKPRQNDAQNTSFGAPPILVLRIGDFYNTKIIPRNLSFTYDPLLLDLNPEGIGIQPMLATVTLSFDLIGGMGLEKPVEQLQNALSFNYYANTEIYDERSTWTDDSWKALDKQYFQDILDAQPTVTNVDNQQTNTAGETIGQIQTTINSESGQTGDITYMRIMDSLLDVTKEYYTDVVNQAESMTKSYNDGIWQLTSKDLLYVDGEFNLDNSSMFVPIYGKSVFDDKIDELFTKTLEDIDNDTNYIILGLIDDNFNDTTIREVKSNLKKYITDYKVDFSLGVNEIINNLVNQQVSMVQVFRKINYVTTLSDGVIIDSKPKVYSISATTEISNLSLPEPLDTYDELWKDYQTVGNNILVFNEFLVTKQIITKDYIEPGGFNTTSTAFDVSNISDKRFFMIMSQIFNNRTKFNEFKDIIITNQMDNTTSGLRRKFDNIVGDFRDKVVEELDAEEKFYNSLKKSQEYKDFLAVENLYKKGKTRKFTYTTVPNSSTNEQQTTDLLLLYQGNNGGDNIIWTDKTQFN